MSTSRLWRWHPVLILGIATYILVVLPGIMAWDYDDHTVATLVFLSGRVLGFVFHLLNAGFSALNGGVAMPYQAPLVSVLGLGVYVAADVGLTRHMKRQHGHTSMDRPEQGASGD